MRSIPQRNAVTWQISASGSINVVKYCNIGQITHGGRTSSQGGGSAGLRESRNAQSNFEK